MHTIIFVQTKKNKCVLTLPQSLRPVTPNTLIFLFGLIKGKKGETYSFIALKSKLSDNVLILLINVTFMSRINELCFEHEYSFIIPRPDHEAIKLFSSSTQLRMKFQLLIKSKMLKNADFFLL